MSNMFKALFNAVLTRAFSTSNVVHKQDYIIRCIVSLMSIILVSDIQCRLFDASEVRTTPDPGAVRDHVGWIGDHRSVVGVELACLVSRTVVEWVTDRWHRTVGHALHTFRWESARHFVDHSLSLMILPVPSCATASYRSYFTRR